MGLSTDKHYAKQNNDINNNNSYNHNQINIQGAIKVTDAEK